MELLNQNFFQIKKSLNFYHYFNPSKIYKDVTLSSYYMLNYTMQMISKILGLLI